MGISLERMPVLTELIPVITIVQKNGAVSFVSTRTWKEVSCTFPTDVENFGRALPTEPFMLSK